MRFAILGLYNSGSSALAGMLHCLGANLGPPFWGERSGHASTVYEADDLARELRRWWAEPLLEEQATTAERGAYLSAWIRRQESLSSQPAGAKHPLLALCAPELLEAWGPDILFVWSWRPLSESVAGLARRGWFPGREPAIQQRLWDAIKALDGRREINLVRVDWQASRRDPVDAARRLAGLVGLEPGAEQLAAAAAVVRPG